jgi:glucose/arabinose dehydrogenase
VAAGGQGGLLDVVLDSGFATNRTLYFCFSEPASAGAGNSTALARSRLSEDRTQLEDVRVIFSQRPKVASSLHFGCRIVEGMKDGPARRHAVPALGERLPAHAGRADAGQPPRQGGAHGQGRQRAPRQPVRGPSRRALPEIWSYGHRNPQGATLGPDGRLWMHEHGPQGGDEINLPQPGRNYGWPVITYGEQYGGGPIGAGITAKDGMEQPLHHWTPSIAPSGMAFLTSDRYGPAWKGSLFVGSLKFQFLNRVELAGGKVVREERLLGDLGERIRDVRQGPDGYLYVLTDNPKGRLMRLVPP